MEIAFCKYQGTGNDFIIIDHRHMTWSLSQDMITRLCHRRFGIGADGLILLQSSIEADFTMRYYNADGRESTMCGNGGRCIVAFAIDMGLSDKQNEIRFLAADGIHKARILRTLSHGFEVELQMQDVNSWEITSDNELIVHTGSPHFVKNCTSLAQADIVSMARKIRYNSRFEQDGINVNFIERESQILHVRTYERGVEDETYSCGTGVVASSIACYLLMGFVPDKIITPGGELSVKFTFQSEQFSEIYLSGPAIKVFDGTLEME